MKNEIYERVIAAAFYALDHGCTIRQVAKALGVSKSTIHLDLSKRLASASPILYEKVQKLLDNNFKMKHINGGLATKKRYKNTNGKKSTKVYASTCKGDKKL